jgi:hypothetical protein
LEATVSALICRNWLAGDGLALCDLVLHTHGHVVGLTLVKLLATSHPLAQRGNLSVPLWVFTLSGYLPDIFGIALWEPKGPIGVKKNITWFDLHDVFVVASPLTQQVRPGKRGNLVCPTCFRSRCGVPRHRPPAFLFMKIRSQ